MMRSAMRGPTPGMVASWSAVAVFRFTGAAAAAIAFGAAVLPWAPTTAVLNAMAALLTAWGMEAPVLALAGQIPAHAIDRNYGHLHDTPDQIGILAHVTKHANATRVDVRLMRDAERVCLVVEDNGMGPDAAFRTASKRKT